MPTPSWEASTSNWSYGYLKFLEFQKQGFDVHVTFQREKKRVHASVYLVGRTDEKVAPSVWMTVQTWGLAITDHKMDMIKDATQSKAWPSVPGYTTYKEYFLAQSNVKALELGFIAEKPAPKTTVTLDLKSDSEFPPLGGKTH